MGASMTRCRTPRLLLLLLLPSAAVGWVAQRVVSTLWRSAAAAQQGAARACAWRGRSRARHTCRCSRRPAALLLARSTHAAAGPGADWAGVHGTPAAPLRLATGMSGVRVPTARRAARVLVQG
jgi:hypothetical protein